MKTYIDGLNKALELLENNPCEADGYHYCSQQNTYKSLIKAEIKVSQIEPPVILRSGDLVVVSHFSDYDYPFDAVKLGRFDKREGNYFYVQEDKRGYKYCKFVHRPSESK